MAQLINEAKRFQKLAGILKEAVEVPSWLAGKLEDVHTKPGQGSIFAKSVGDVLKLAQDTLDKEQNIDKIANSTGTLTIKSPGIGYNLVLPIEKAKQLPGAKESEVEKIEGPNKIKVPAITTNAPLTQFKTDELTIIVRPKKDESGAVIPNEYIVLSAFPGDPSIPRASEWGRKYAVIIPDGKEKLKEVLDDLKDAQTAASWLKTQLDTYIDNNLDGYGAGYKVEEQLEKLLKLVTKKFNIPENSFKIEDKYNTSYNEYDEGTTKGEIKLNGQIILTYSSNSDGYGFSADIDENALKTQLEKLIPTNEVFNQLDEIVDRALLKMRKQLNENLIQSNFEEIIDNLIDKAIEDDFYGSGPSDEDEEEQLRNIVVSRAQEELETKYPGIEVGVQLTNKGNHYYTVENKEKNIPYLEYTRS